ncbi:hypothetical protein SDC9_153155 [bioreactor metagenome]|uniref:Uncharacterized protein n=1 Tax=bioreactor metagenome TaxID=1076179 RepID=A0A645EV40_9ZZZZ
MYSYGVLCFVLPLFTEFHYHTGLEFHGKFISGIRRCRVDCDFFNQPLASGSLYLIRAVGCSRRKAPMSAIRYKSHSISKLPSVLALMFCMDGCFIVKL